ncbi:Dienelactone hydrolase [Polaromonas sp. OV174]|uniref:alpha/beta hydrolase family protein n=1 Tax=Polaromonas sp. OV174 TaxID=1855300 RepID=UPI0008DFD531|nr:alpha/beta hydrolase [Polaromonas sp. OV174]SFC23829.1 Dienelactone hydrolase [Polaromonas sp. OV174]
MPALSLPRFIKAPKPLACAALIAGLTATASVQAWLVEEVMRVPVAVSNGYGKPVAQDIVVTVFHDDAAAKPYPLLILGHGRSPDAARRQALGQARYSANARWFTRLGYMVAVPTRVGYGESGGEDVEDTGSCNHKNYPPGYAAAALQTLKVLETLRQRPDAAKDRAVILGQSFGGTTAVAVAAMNPPGVQAAINFAGGGGGNPKTMPQNPCAPARLERLFAGYGKTARLPTLWVYTENDMFMGPTHPREWFDAFEASGGQGDYTRFPPHGEDGHGLFTRAPEVWQPLVLDFFRAHGYPELQAPPAKP